MSSASARRWRRVSSQRIPNQVGSFFERLTSQITSGAQPSDDTSDFMAWQMDAALEIKGCDNTHAIRIPFDQLKRYSESATGFPYSNALYMLFRYTNRPVGESKTGLLRAGTKEKRAAFLFERLKSLWIIDHRLLLALAKRRLPRTNLLPLDRERSCLTITQRDLGRLYGAEWSEEITRLGFAPEDWNCNHRVIRLDARYEQSTITTRLVVSELLPAKISAIKLVKRASRLTITLPVFDDLPAF